MPPDESEPSAPAADPPADAPLFSSIEAFVETATEADIEALFAELSERLAGLKGTRAQQGKKVLAAIEGTRALLQHLLQVRDTMGKESGENEP